MKPNTQPTEAAAPTVANLGKRLAHEIEGVRSQFVSYSQGFSAISTRSSDLAPKFMKAYEHFHKKTNGSFISFVRIFDATVPEDVEEYKSHSTYNAANYLRRTYLGEQAGLDRSRAAGRRDKPLNVEAIVASAVAALMPYIAADQVDAAWRQVQLNTKLSDSRIEKCKALVPQADPMINLRPARGSASLKHTLRVAA